MGKQSNRSRQTKQNNLEIMMYTFVSEPELWLVLICLVLLWVQIPPSPTFFIWIKKNSKIIVAKIESGDIIITYEKRDNDWNKHF